MVQLRVAGLALLLVAVTAARNYIVRLRDHAEAHHHSAITNLVMHRHSERHFSRHRGTVMASFTHRLFKGFVATDVSPAMHEELLNHPMVDRIYPDLPRQATGLSVPWGLDRIDQQSLPLDGKYRPELQGEGVNTFILDSGIDTLHGEFNDPGRKVENIYDHYAQDHAKPGRNNDYYGHGTHVAGIVGGRSVGVAPKSNIYGVKILDNKGGGTDSTVIAGLLYVADWVEEERTRTGAPVPAVVCMSLGGSCLFPGCENEVMIDLLGNFTARGLHIVVAAGNDHCDSCHAAPAASTDVLTVGATTRSDTFAPYSNHGHCVDVIAPGSRISSVCSGKKCSHSESSYRTLSGTSMAAPHLAGVVAHILSIHPSATNQVVREKVLCTVVKGKVRNLPTNTRNRLAQVLVSGQDISALNSTCSRGAGCPASCSGRGDCVSGRCICDNGYFGAQCQSTVPVPKCAANEKVAVSLDLISFKGHGWPSLSYSLVTAEGNPVKDGSLACGASTRETLCLAPGCYSIETAGKLTNAADTSYAWAVCGTSGHVPGVAAFCVDESGDCQPSFSSCSHNSLHLRLRDAYGDGWTGGLLTARKERLGNFNFADAANPSETYSTSTLAWGHSQSQQLCWANGVYSLSSGGGEFPDEISYSLCGVEGLASGEYAVQVNATDCSQVFLESTFIFTIHTQGYNSSAEGSKEAIIDAVAIELERSCNGCTHKVVLLSVAELDGHDHWQVQLTVQLPTTTHTSVHKFMTELGQSLNKDETINRIKSHLQQFVLIAGVVRPFAQHADHDIVVMVSMANSYDVAIQQPQPDANPPTPSPVPAPSPPPRHTTKVRASNDIWIAATVASVVLVGSAVVAAVVIRVRSAQGHQRLNQEDQDEDVSDDDDDDDDDGGDELVEIDLYEAAERKSWLSAQMPSSPWWWRWRMRRTPQMIVQLNSPGVTFEENTDEFARHAQHAVAVTTEPLDTEV